MKICFCLLLMLSPAAYCQQQLNNALRQNIKAMYTQDQKWRIESRSINSGKTSAYSDDVIERNMELTDSTNMVAAKSIINHYGFPGYDLVGEDGTNAFWAIIQHCDDDIAFQQQALKMMGIQVKKHNTNAQNYALLQDRVLVNTHHKQIYGTQITVDAKTRKPKPFPIQDSAHVDQRRYAIGLSPLSEYVKSFERYKGR